MTGIAQVHPEALEEALDELGTHYEGSWRAWPIETLAGTLAHALNAAHARAAVKTGRCAECLHPDGGHEAWCADPANPESGKHATDWSTVEITLGPGSDGLEQVYTVVVFDQAGNEARRWYERGYSAMGCMTQITQSHSDRSGDPARMVPGTPSRVVSPAQADQLAYLAAAALRGSVDSGDALRTIAATLLESAVRG